MRSLNRWILTAAVTALLAACEAVDGGLVGPSGEASLTGRVQEQTETYMGVPAPAHYDATGASAAPQSAATSAAVSTVEAARVNADGSLTVVARGNVSADGSYRIEGVPTGRSDLMVVARSAAGAEQGRVLVAGQSQAGEMIAAPITARSTVQALAYSEIRAMGGSAADVSPAELELLFHADGSSAATLARSRTDVRAMASAYLQAREASDRTYARLGHTLSADARQRILLNVQAEEQARLHQGTNAESSYETFLSASTEALVASGVSADAVVLASAAAAAAAARASAGSSSTTRLMVARGTARMNLAARAALLARVPASAERERTATAQALASGRVSVRLASSTEEVDEALAQVETSARQNLMLEVTIRLTGVGSDVRTRAEAAWNAAYDSADLSADLRGETTASGWAEAAARYRQRVGALAQAYVDSAPSSFGVQSSTTADLFVAARGG